MLSSAEQFRSLRESDDPDEYRRAAQDEAPIEVWLDVIARMPDKIKGVKSQLLTGSKSLPPAVNS